MSDALSAVLPLVRWEGDRGTYHLVIFTGSEAEALTMHARLQRLEFGKRRGFGSVKVRVRVGETEWKSSVFPQKQQCEWVLLISKKVMQQENLAEGNPVKLKLELL
ncbi:DUF1905 domain-containing protein [Erythrobacter sp. WH131]|uniref:DUF1905 domain-containing protein n=1 Tax=Erythrobacter ani TaxID=2827235 RepID=A0ABS6SNL0_9SPHN|nr:DUF1905 domain-containing protein [Erythrobacter ani]